MIKNVFLLPEKSARMYIIESVKIASMVKGSTRARSCHYYQTQSYKKWFGWKFLTVLKSLSLLTELFRINWWLHTDGVIYMYTQKNWYCGFLPLMRHFYFQINDLIAFDWGYCRMNWMKLVTQEIGYRPRIASPLNIQWLVVAYIHEY